MCNLLRIIHGAEAAEAVQSADPVVDGGQSADPVVEEGQAADPVVEEGQAEEVAEEVPPHRSPWIRRSSGTILPETGSGMFHSS